MANDSTSTKYRILSLDGGGIRGIVTARILEKVIARFPNFFSKTNLYAGTSVGSINAVCLSQGKSPTDLVGLYDQQGPTIFHDDLLRNLGDLHGTLGAKYNTENRYNALHPIIGDATLNQLRGKTSDGGDVNVLVPTFQLDAFNPISPAKPGSPDSWRAKFFHNFEKDNHGEPNADLDQKAIDVVMRSSAAPTYFPVYQGFIDGGVVANDPGICALTQAINEHTGKQNIKNVTLLSIGVGIVPKALPTTNGNWGLLQWGPNIIDLLMSANVGLSDYQCDQLLGDCYFRANINMAHDIPLDAYKQTKTLIDIVDQYEAAHNLDPLFDWIEKQWLTDPA